MRSKRPAVLAISGALAALAMTVAPASAVGSTSLQTTAGAPYTGVLNFTLDGNAKISSTYDITCNESPVTASVTDAGSPGNSAAGTITAIDFKSVGLPTDQGCPTTIIGALNLDNTATVPWALSISRIDENTIGAPNGAVVASGVRVTTLITCEMVGCSQTCTYNGDFNNTGGSTNQMEGDFYNPDNTPAPGNTELRFVNEPLELDGLASTASCPPGSATFSANYDLTGAGSTKLQLREPVAAPTCLDLSRTTPFQTPLAVTLDCVGIGTLTFNPPSTPAHGTISGFNSMAGTLTYTPDAGYSGPDSFTYTASNDGGPSAVKTVSVTVGANPTPPVNDPPSSGTPPSTPDSSGAAGKKCKKKKKSKKHGAAAAKKCRKK